MSLLDKWRRNWHLRMSNFPMLKTAGDDFLHRLFEMQTTLIEHKFPHDKAQIIDSIISYAGDIYREMVGGVYRHTSFGYIYDKWEKLSGYCAKPQRTMMTDGDWEEIREELAEPDYKVQRDEYLVNLQRLRGETASTTMDSKQKEVLLEALDMMRDLIFWFESLRPDAAPVEQLDRLTGAIGSYFPQFWED